MKKIVTLLIVAFTVYSANAQFAEKIVSGRPGFSNGPFAVGKNIYQVQSGFQVQEENFLIVNNASGARVGFRFPVERLILQTLNHASVFRIGVAEKTEVRAAYSYNSFNNAFNNADENRFKGRYDKQDGKSQLSNLAFGVRQNLTNQNNFVPALGLQFTTFFNLQTSNNSDFLSYQLRLLLQHKIGEKFVLNTNITSPLESSDTDYLLSLSYSASEKIRLVGEFYGTKFFDETIFRKDNTKNFNIGFGYYITNDFQLDLFGGHNINGGDFKSYFISTGISYRINRR